MPKNIEEMILAVIEGKQEAAILTNNTPNPFAPIGQNQRYYTLSGGLFDEMHPKADTAEYFHALLNTKTKRIIGFTPLDTSANSDIDPVVFALSVDPLAAMLPSYSPYAAFNDNPILNIDPTGASAEGGPDDPTTGIGNATPTANNGSDNTTPKDPTNGGIGTVVGPATTNGTSTIPSYTPSNLPANTPSAPSLFNQALISINEFNPLANLFNAVNGWLTGYDVNGRPQSTFDINMNLLGAIPLISVESGEAKGLLQAEKVATASADASEVTYKAFTSNNFRENLTKITKETVDAEYDAHHVFPQRYREKFAEAGLNIDNPKYGAWWEKTSHLKNAYQYNQNWSKFIFDHPNPTQEQILDYGREIMKEYGFNVNY